MRSKWQLIARRVSISISLTALAVGAGLYIIQRQWNLSLQIALGLFVIGLAVFVALDPETIRKALTGRQARYGSNALILAVAFLGILVVINFLAYKNTKRWDLTENQANTLAKESVDVLKSIQNNVVAKAFFTTSSAIASSKDSAKSLLDKYVYTSGGKFQYQFVDPNKDPIAAQDAGITKDGTIVLYMGNAKQPVSTISETDITAAMIRLMNPDTHVIYFLTGHGEYDIQGGGDQSYTQLATDLGLKNYKVATLNLISSNQVPADASVVVIAGPKKPLLDSEVSVLDAYLNTGGSLVVMEDPTIVTQFGNAPDPLATDLAQNYGIDLGNDVVIDYSGYQQYGNALFALSAQYATHAITKNMKTQITGFLIARSVSANDTAGANYSKTQLVLTSDGSWGETDMNSIQNNNSPTYDQAGDVPGPISLAVAASETTTNARLIVFGNSEFATNSGYSWFGNGTLILNSIDWAAKVENLINLTPKTTVDRTLVIPKTYTINLIFLGSLIGLPGLILLAGIGTWVARRRQG
jgi:gliding motility-associatede transport system auxiliary component